MQHSEHQTLIGLIWNIANKLRGPYRPPQYRKVMLPLDAEPGIVTQDVVRIKVDKEWADKVYLIDLLNSSIGRCVVRAVTVEATRGRFLLETLKHFALYCRQFRVFTASREKSDYCHRNT